MGHRDRLNAAGVIIPEPPTPIACFVNHKRVGNLLFLSGQGPREADGYLHTGKVGLEVSLEEASRHARLTGLNLVAVAEQALGDIERIESFVKLLGMVNSAPEFSEHSKVIDGCSNLLREVFGSAGEHARSAIGVASLPNNITVEIEAIVAVRS